MVRGPTMEQRARGERHGMAWLTEAQVRAIRAARQQDPPVTYSNLAIQFDVSNGTISAVLSGRTWRHVL